MSLHDLAQRWEREAELLDGYGATEASAAARRHAAELTEAILTAEEEELSISQAAAESGYSSRRLREFIAEGSIENSGERGRPRIKRRDLPRKTNGRTTTTTFDAAQHASDILGGTR